MFDEIICCDSDWSEMIKHAFEKAGTPYVMLFMDDYLLTDKINNEDIIHHIELIKENNAVNIRLLNGAFSKKKVLSDELMEIESGSAYSLSTQVGIWDTVFLKDFIKDGWSPWDFEREGSLIRLSEKRCILESRKYRFPYVEGVRRGKWMPECELPR